jgi:hypothetical protein
VKTYGAFVLLALTEIALFFHSPRHFFIGDTLTWMGFRYHTIGEFLAGFLRTDPKAWYRPLSQRTVISVLYPFAGLNPVAYRVAGVLLFFACTLALFQLAKRLAKSSRIAWFSVLMFAPNVTNAFTTYDAAYFPEMLFTLFCVGSLIAFVGKRNVLATVLFIAALLSKETAVALPLALAFTWLLLPRKERSPAKALLPYFGILAAYLVFAIGYVHVRDIQPRQLIERPGRIGQPGYELVPGKHVVENFDVAFSWAFGIPRLGYTEDMLPAAWTLKALKIVRACLLFALLIALFTPRRRIALIGLAWFVSMLLPTAPMPNHFLPYYLFAPLLGFSLAAGVALDWLCQQRWGMVFCVGLLAVSGGIQALAGNQLASRHGLLGPSAQRAQDSVRDVLAAAPEIPANSVIVIYNNDYPILAGEHADGALFTMAYNDPTLFVWYSGDGGPAPLDRYPSDHVFTFRWSNNHLIAAR